MRHGRTGQHERRRWRGAPALRPTCCGGRGDGAVRRGLWFRVGVGQPIVVSAATDAGADDTDRDGPPAATDAPTEAPASPTEAPTAPTEAPAAPTEAPTVEEPVAPAPGPGDHGAGGGERRGQLPVVAVAVGRARRGCRGDRRDHAHAPVAEGRAVALAGCDGADGRGARPVRRDQHPPRRARTAAWARWPAPMRAASRCSSRSSSSS